MEIVNNPLPAPALPVVLAGTTSPDREEIGTASSLDANYLSSLEDRVARVLLEQFSLRLFSDCIGMNGKNFGTTFLIGTEVLSKFPNEKAHVLDIIGFYQGNPDDPNDDALSFSNPRPPACCE